VTVILSDRYAVLTTGAMKRHPTKKQRKRQEAQKAEGREVSESSANTQTPGYFRRNGLPLALLLSGVAYIFIPYFWLFVVLFLAGAALLAIDVWKEVVLPKDSRSAKLIFFIVCSLLSAIFAVWLFFPVPLRLSVTSTIPRYGENSNIYGIMWSNDFSQMDLTLKNSGDADYDNFDAEISTDLTFEGLKQTGGISACAIAPTNSVIHPINQKMAGGVPLGPAETNPTQYKIVGFGPNGEITSFSGDTAQKYRIRCDKFPANSEETFTAALSVINLAVAKKQLGTPPQLGTALRLPPKIPSWCTMRAKFTYLGRPRSAIISQCKVGQDCALQVNVGDYFLTGR